MNKRIALILISLSIFSLCAVNASTVNSSLKTITVPDDYPTIQKAIANAVAGDTIYVRKGVYVENPVVNKSVSLVGEDKDSTVIDVTEGLKVENDNVTLTGFTIYDGWHGISLSANYCNISGNRIVDSTNGIVVSGKSNRITGNIFQSIGLSSAIQLNFADRNLVNNNNIDSCVEGIQIWQNSNNNTVTENTMINCEDHAFRFQYSNDNTIMRNNISNSGCGTSIYGSNNNIISYNNYVNNTVQFSANEDYYLTFGYNRSINTINENYWSDYNGTDANGDGVGDTPYIIDANNKDNYPFMRSVNFTSTSPNPTLTPSSSPSPSTTSAPSLTFTPTVSSPAQTDTTITLSWTKTNTTTFGILGSYQVTFTTSANSSYNIATTITDWNQTSYTVTGLTPNTTYYFIIRYIGNNVIGSNLALSNTLEVKTSSRPSASDSPTQQPTPTQPIVHSNPHVPHEYEIAVVTVLLVAITIIGLAVYFTKFRKKKETA